MESFRQSTQRRIYTLAKPYKKGHCQALYGTDTNMAYASISSWKSPGLGNVTF